MLLAALLFAFPDRTPEDTAKSLKGPDGFEFTVFASEPMVVNPTNMEVDSRGRVWVTEGLNYRFFANKDFKRVPGADKIKILEDTDGDGKADKVTVFAENIYPVPMGLAIQEIWKDGKYAGCRVFTGNSPDLLVFEDTNGDDKADSRKVLLTGFGGYDSDHGVHGMYLGPDGLLYFTQGDGKYGGQGGPKLPPGATMSVTGPDGRKVESFKDGTVLRCNLDGTGLELVATGLRNNYEVAVDSFGRIFASDNDDDGNRGCRMCWILPGAHYGYKTPGSPRHWGEENPANMPKLVGTGNGSPCGIMVYEGELLPPEVRGAVLQVDAGTRQINLHPLTKVGASLRTEYKVLVKGDDPQFRPVDCCTAPDGSLMIADWYDAGVGGHRFTDQKTGRVYRLAPKGMKYERPKVDFQSPTGMVKAIGSPNVTTSFAGSHLRKELIKNTPTIIFDNEFRQAHKNLGEFAQMRGVQSTAAFEDSWTVESFGKASDKGSDRLEVFLRACQRDAKNRETDSGLPRLLIGESVKLILADPDACLEALLILKNRTKSLDQLTALIRAWDGSDRFYLQAIRIGCQSLSSDAKKELSDALLDDALKFKAANDDFALPPYYPTGSNEAFPLPSDPVPPTDARGKLIGVAWVLESIEALPALERLMSERPSDAVNRGVMMALSRFRDPKAADAIFALLSAKGDPFQKAAMLQLLGDRLKKDWWRVKEDPRCQALYRSALDDAELRLTALRTMPEDLIKRHADLREKIAGMVGDSKQDMAEREAAFTTLLRMRDPTAWKTFDAELKTAQGAATAPPLALAGVSALTSSVAVFSGDKNKVVQIIHDTKYPIELRRRAVQTLSFHPNTAKELAYSHKTKPLPEDVLADARFFLHAHADGGVRYAAGVAMPIPTTVGRTVDVRKLLSMEGSAERGRALFFSSDANACGKCHRVQGIGQWVGPDLSAIGEKYPKSEIYYHIVKPSGAMAFGYQNWRVAVNDGRVLNGLIVEESSERIVLRTAAGDRLVIRTGDIESQRSVPASLMPEKLIDALKDEQVADLLEYLSSLRQPVVEAAEYRVVGPMDADKLAAVTGADGGWRTLSTGRDGVLDLSGMLRSQKDGSGMAALLTVRSPTDQQVKLVLSTAIPLKLFVNGTEVAVTPGKQGGQSAEITLKNGKNEVLLKLSSGVDRPQLTTAFVTKRPVRLTAE
jgi:putative membrane-bound dehydrogenase-like protein